ncbi:MAG: hypothetical protein IH586_04115, partial [Anaerolineaceae bacterium]|nr:hypothetical protein [Anaerolineaceae bacterium]
TSSGIDSPVIGGGIAVTGGNCGAGKFSQTASVPVVGESVGETVAVSVRVRVGDGDEVIVLVELGVGGGG